MTITPSQQSKQTKASDAARRRRQRPQPVRGLKLFQGEVVWEKPVDAQWNVTHYRIYANTENNLVREVPVGQIHAGDLTGDRIFVSSYNQDSGLESAKVMLSQPVIP